MASQENMNSLTMHETADRLAKLQISVVPIGARTKEPPPGFRWGDYATRIADASERWEWFAARGHQLAVVPGTVSGNLVPLDFDGPNGFESLAAEHPHIRAYPRVRTGSGKVHVWVRTRRPTRKYVTTAPDGSKIEVRAGAHYTVCPPSIHPCGEPYRWEVEPWGGIPTIDLEDIGLKTIDATEAEHGEPMTEGDPLTPDEREHIARLVAPHYVPNARHELCLALAGWLANLGVPEADAQAIVDVLAADHGDHGRRREFRRAVRDTYAKACKGVAVIGWARLVSEDDPLVSPAVAKQLDLLLRQREPTFTFETPVPPRGAGVTLAELQRMRFAPLKWVIDGMLPEGGLLLCGKPKSKKSWLGLAISLAVAMRGLAFGSLKTINGRVLYLDLEGNQRRIQTRVGAILGSEAVPWPANFHLYTTGEWPEGDDGFRALEQWFVDFPDTVMVVVDVLQDFRPPIKKGENPYDYDRNILKRVNALAERNHAVIILIHHTRKAKGDDALDEVSGTLGAPSAVSTIWVLGPSQDSQHTILKQRGRDLFNEDDLALRWDLLHCIHRIDGTADELNASRERQAVLDFLADDRPRPLKEIAAAVNKSVTATANLLAHLVTDRLVEKVGYGQYARVPRQR